MRSLFGGGQQSSLPGPLGAVSDLIQKFNRFRQNPLGALLSSGVNVPQNVGNNPEAIVNYLRNSGQMSEEQFNQLNQMANQFQNFIPR